MYTLHDKMPSLDDYIVAGCRYGGPIGMSPFLKLVAFGT